jgi:hypothetical protein
VFAALGAPGGASAGIVSPFGGMTEIGDAFGRGAGTIGTGSVGTMGHGSTVGRAGFARGSSSAHGAGFAAPVEAAPIITIDPDGIVRRTRLLFPGMSSFTLEIAARDLSATEQKELSKQDRENYGKLARILYGAAKQEQDAVETARDLKPRAESAAANTKNSPLNLASTQPKKLNDGVKGLSDVLAEGPQHLATLTSVAQHLAKIGGVDLTDSKFQPKVVTNEDEIPTDW